VWAYLEWTEIPITEPIVVGEMIDAVKTMKQDPAMKKINPASPNRLI